MKMKKTLLCILAAAAIVSSAVSCGSSDDGGDKDKNNGDSAAAAQTDAAASASDVADKLRSDIEYVDELNEISEEMIEKIYGVSSDKYSNAKVYVGGVSTAEEIACFDAVDETAAGDIKKACEDRISAQIKSVESYNPDELPKLNDPVLVVKGNSVYMCLSNDNDKAKEIIG